MINYKVNDNNKYLLTEGGTLLGDLNMSGCLIKNVASPVDDSDIVNYSTLNTKLASTDPYKVGDILYTTRTDLGDKWALCNGSTAPVDSSVGKMLPMNITTSSLYKTIKSYVPVVYYNGIFYSVEFDGANNGSTGYSNTRPIYLRSLKFGETTQTTLYTNTSNYVPMLVVENAYHSNDGYININYYTASSSAYTYKTIRYQISNKKTTETTNSDGKNYWSYYFNGYYYTIVPNVGIYRGASFNARTTLIKSISQFTYTPFNFYHDKKNNDLYLPLYQGKSNIIRINSSNQIIEITPSNGINYSDQYESLTSVVRNEDDQIIISQYFIYKNTYEKYTLSDAGYVCIYDRNTNSCTKLNNCPGFLPLLSDQLQKINGKYITLNLSATSSDNSYYMKSTLKTCNTISGTYTSTDFYGIGGNRYGPQSYARPAIFTNDNGIVICFGADYWYYNDGGIQQIWYQADYYQWVNLPTISSNKSYAYIKVKE